jgi:hypothetical protein
VKGKRIKEIGNRKEGRGEREKAERSTLKAQSKTDSTSTTNKPTKPIWRSKPTN